MRADRLVSLVLLLRQRGRMSATALADELEVSTRTVLRDIGALSAAGVPVYSERGRHGGFALLPGFRAELTGLSHDEALVLLAAGSRRTAEAFGLGSALASARLKLVDALPGGPRISAVDSTGRLLAEPETDLLERRVAADVVAEVVLAPIRRAVLVGRRLRLHYAALEREPAWRVVDPVGLVTVRGRGYLLATRSGADRTYRLSRVIAAEVLDEPAERPAEVDLEEAWRRRGTAFRTGGDQVGVVLRVRPERREDVIATAVAVLADDVAEDWHRLEVTFQDARHAVWALWELGADAEALAPPWLRTSLRERALTIAQRYGPTESAPSG